MKGWNLLQVGVYGGSVPVVKYLIGLVSNVKSSMVAWHDYEVRVKDGVIEKIPLA